MNKIVKINKKPGSGEYWGLYDVTISDGDKQWNAHFNQNSFRQQCLMEEIDALTDDLSQKDKDKLFEKIEELESLAYQRGSQDEAETY
jgi:hypothetical protein